MTEQVDHDLHAVNRAAKRVADAALSVQNAKRSRDAVLAWERQKKFRRALAAYEEAVGRARRSQEAG